MPTNADLIRAVRQHDPDSGCEHLTPLADALEASEAQVAEQTAQIEVHLRVHGEPPEAIKFPLDLLEAVRYIVGGECADVGDGCEFCKARATLRRYGLLKEAGDAQ